MDGAEGGTETVVQTSLSSHASGQEGLKERKTSQFLSSFPRCFPFALPGEFSVAAVDLHLEVGVRVVDIGDHFVVVDARVLDVGVLANPKT